MKINLYIILILVSSCFAQKKSVIKSEESSLCDILNNNKGDVTIQKLESNYNSKIKEIKLSNGKFLSKEYKYQRADLDFTILYSKSKGMVIVKIKDRQFEFAKGDYFRLYEEDFSTGLEWMNYTNYLLQFHGKQYLVIRTFPNFNESVAFNNLYYLISLSSGSLKESYSFGSFGYCDNIFNDYNIDGNLDITLIDLVSISTERFDYINPKGKFKAKVFSLKGGKILPLENNNGAIHCEYSYSGEDISIEKGNWF